MEIETDGGLAVGDEVRRAHRRWWLSVGSAAAVVLVGVAAVVGSRTYPYWTPLGPGPGFFPRCLGGLLVVCGLMWLLQLVRAARSAGAIQALDEGDRVASGSAGSTSSSAVADSVVVPEDEAPEYSLPTVLAIVVSLCVLAATLEVVGYQIAMFVFVLFHLLVLGRRRLLLSLVLALVCSVGVFVAFTRFLTVPLPASSIPFLRDMGF